VMADDGLADRELPGDLPAGQALVVQVPDELAGDAARVAGSVRVPGGAAADARRDVVTSHPGPQCDDVGVLVAVVAASGAGRGERPGRGPGGDGLGA
jgi:hypothetical protein